MGAGEKPQGSGCLGRVSNSPSRIVSVGSLLHKFFQSLTKFDQTQSTTFDNNNSFANFQSTRCAVRFTPKIVSLRSIFLLMLSIDAPLLHCRNILWESQPCNPCNQTLNNVNVFFGICSHTACSVATTLSLPTIQYLDQYLGILHNQLMLTFGSHSQIIQIFHSYYHGLLPEMTDQTQRT